MGVAGVGVAKVCACSISHLGVLVIFCRMKISKHFWCALKMHWICPRKKVWVSYYLGEVTEPGHFTDPEHFWVTH